MCIDHEKEIQTRLKFSFARRVHEDNMKKRNQTFCSLALQTYTKIYDLRV